MKFYPFKHINENGIIEFENETFAAIIQILGFEFNLLDEEKQNEQIRILANFFKSQKNKITFFKTNLPFDLTKQKAFINSLKSKENEVYLKQLIKVEKENISENCYFFIVYGYTRTELENNINNSLVILNQGRLTANKITLKTTQMLLKKFFGSMNNTLPKEFSLPYYINFKLKNFHTEKEWKKVLTINKFPLTVNNGWLSKIINLKDTDFIFQIENIPTLEAKQQLDKSLAIIKVNLDQETLPSEIEEIEANLNSLDNLITEITTGDEVLKNVSFNILLSSYLQEALLQEKENKLQEICRQYNLEFEGNYLNQQESFYVCLPKISEEKQVSKQLISSISLASFFPFLTPNFADEKGLCLGKISNGYLFFDLFQQDEKRINSNMFIIGTSGSGKSFFSKKLITQRILLGDKVFIIDPEREYQNLSSKFGGNWFDCNLNFKEINLNKQLTILDFFNLLDMENRKYFDERIFIILQKIEKEIQQNYLQNQKNLSDFFASKETKEFSLAIIKNCNYSAFFKLSSGDVNDLAMMMKNNPLSSKEMQILLTLGRGNCLFNLSGQVRFLTKILV